MTRTSEQKKRDLEMWKVHQMVKARKRPASKRCSTNCGECCKTQLKNLLEDNSGRTLEALGLPRGQTLEVLQARLRAREKLLEEHGLQCPLLGSDGCTLPRNKRPIPCLTFLCTPEKERRKVRPKGKRIPESQWLTTERCISEAQTLLTYDNDGQIHLNTVDRKLCEDVAHRKRKSPLSHKRRNLVRSTFIKYLGHL